MISSTLRFVAFFVALLIVNAVSFKCPSPKRVSFEQAACLEPSTSSATETLELDSLFDNVGYISSEYIWAYIYECEDLDRKHCIEVEPTALTFDFYENSQTVKVSRKSCEDSKMASNPYCVRFTDIGIYIGHSKTCDEIYASVMVPNTNAAIFGETEGCNLYSPDDSYDQCPDVTLVESHSDLVNFPSQNSYQLAGVSHQEQLEFFEEAYFETWTDDYVCWWNTYALEFPVTEFNFNLEDHYSSCSPNALKVRFWYLCKQSKVWHSSPVNIRDVSQVVFE